MEGCFCSSEDISRIEFLYVVLGNKKYKLVGLLLSAEGLKEEF
jgi:hypothetical protein